MMSVKDDFGLCLELGGNCLSKTTQVTEGGRESGALGESFKEQGEEVML